MKLSSIRFVLSAAKLDHFPKDRRPEVAFVGRSNVGKSSLLNTLLRKKELARTSGTPGKTQTINFFDINNRFYMVDLPGYGFAKVPMAVKEAWNRLMHQYLTNRDVLRMVGVLVDARHDPSDNDSIMLELLEEAGVPTLIIATKTDKLSTNQLNTSLVRIRRSLALSEDAIVLPFSAVTGKGVKELWQIIEEQIAPPPGNA